MMIGQSIRIRVLWYDKVPEPEITAEHEGEIIKWHNQQVVVRVKGYSVLRFWKKSGFEVGNRDYARRGFFLAIEQVDAKGDTVADPVVAGIKVKMEE